MPERIPHIQYRDIATAYAFSAVSAALNALPEQMNVIGKSDAPSYTPVRWQYARNATHNPSGEWLEFEKDDTSGATPRDYGSIAILKVDREEMDKFMGNLPFTRQAVAYRLGSAVMYGTSSRYNVLGLKDGQAENYEVALRIGRGTLLTQVGKRMRMGRAYAFYPLEKGVRKGDVIKEPALPTYIPLL